VFRGGVRERRFDARKQAESFKARGARGHAGWQGPAEAAGVIPTDLWNSAVPCHLQANPAACRGI